MKPQPEKTTWQWTGLVNFTVGYLFNVLPLTCVTTWKLEWSSFLSSWLKLLQFFYQFITEAIVGGVVVHYINTVAKTLETPPTLCNALCLSLSHTTKIKTKICLFLLAPSGTLTHHHSGLCSIPAVVQAAWHSNKHSWQSSSVGSYWRIAPLLLLLWLPLVV